MRSFFLRIRALPKVKSNGEIRRLCCNNKRIQLIGRSFQSPPTENPLREKKPTINKHDSREFVFQLLFFFILISLSQIVNKTLARLEEILTLYILLFAAFIHPTRTHANLSFNLLNIQILTSWRLLQIFSQRWTMIQNLLRTSPY